MKRARQSEIALRPYQEEAVDAIIGRVQRIFQLLFEKNDVANSDKPNETNETNDEDEFSSESSSESSSEPSSEFVPVDTQVVRARMACGTGKSLVAAQVLNIWRVEEVVRRVCVLVPSTHLLEQLYEAIQWFAPEVLMGRVGDGYAEFGRWCTLCVYNSLHKLLEYNSTHEITVDVCLVDEAHHIEGAFAPDPQKGVWRGRVRELDARAYVMLSASLRADEDILPPLDYDYDLTRAIEDGWLVPFSLVVPVVRGYDTKAKRPTSEVVREHLVRLIERHDDWRHPLVYCNSRGEAKGFCEELCAAGVVARYFDGETPLRRRRQYIREFERGEVRVLCTVQVLGEGVNIPCADTCIFVQPRGSSIDVGQCVGRVLRLHESENGTEKKERARVVCPSMHERYELARMVNLLTDDYPPLRDSIRRGEGVEFVSADKADPNTESDQELLYTTFYKDFVGMLKSAWEMRYNELVKYVEINKHLPLCYKNSFGRWIGTQRSFYLQKRLSDDKIKKLEKIPGWYWERHTKNHQIWMRHYNQLIEDREVKKLRGWKWRQRKLYRLGKLSNKRKLLLEKVKGWRWSYEKPESVWKLNFKRFLNFVETNSRMPPSTNSLYHWKHKMRKRYQLKNLSKNQINFIESIPGWKWEIQKE